MKIKEGIIISFGSALLIATFYFVLDTHDFIKFKQPQRDMLQDTTLLQMKQYYDLQLDFRAEKDKNKQTMINKNTDDIAEIKPLLHTIIENQEKERKINILIFKTVKELKPYSDLFTEKNK